MSENDEQKQKMGDGHLDAWLRQGLRELRAAVYPESNVAQQPEYGLYGTRTPGEVADDRRVIDQDFDEEPSRDELMRGHEQDIDDDGHERQRGIGR
jgi:hypothetical protein